MKDALEEVLRAIERRAFISPVTAGWPVIALISWRTLSSRNYDSIRHFQATIKELFRIQLIAIGGGYGRSKIVFSVEASSHEKASDFVLRIMKSSAFRKVAGEAEFRVVICQDPYIRTDLRTGGQELSERAETMLRAMYGETDTGCIKSGNVTNINNVKGVGG